MATLISHDPPTEIVGHPITYSYPAPAVLHRSHCRCTAWWALVDLLGALVAFLLLEVLLIHLPALLR